MQIDSPPTSLVDEGLITLDAAARLLPRRRGRRVAVSTLWRWAVKGHGGVKLEAMRTPAGWVTSAAAVQRFLEAITAAAIDDEAGREATRAALPTRTAASRAAAELDRLGIGAKRPRNE